MGQIKTKGRASAMFAKLMLLVVAAVLAVAVGAAPAPAAEPNPAAESADPAAERAFQQMQEQLRAIEQLEQMRPDKQTAVRPAGVRPASTPAPALIHAPTAKLAAPVHTSRKLAGAIDTYLKEIEALEKQKKAAGEKLVATYEAAIKRAMRAGEVRVVEELQGELEEVKGEIQGNQSTSRRNLIFDFDFTGVSADGWVPVNDVAQLHLASAALAGVVIGPDPHIARHGLSIPGNGCRTVEIRMALDSGKRAEFYWTTADSPRGSDAKRIPFDVQADGEFHTYTLDVAAHPLWARNTIASIRVDPGSAEFGTSPGAKFAIDYVRGIK